MNKKIKIFYIVDLIVILISIAGMIIVNNKANYGLTALTSVGHFVILLFILLASVILLIIVSLTYFILNKNKNKKQKNKQETTSL